MESKNEKEHTNNSLLLYFWYKNPNVFFRTVWFINFIDIFEGVMSGPSHLWCVHWRRLVSVLQVTAQSDSMEPVITATLLRTTARSSPATPSNMKMLWPSRTQWVRWHAKSPSLSRCLNVQNFPYSRSMFLFELIQRSIASLQNINVLDSLLIWFEWNSKDVDFPDKSQQCSILSYLFDLSYQT